MISSMTGFAAAAQDGDEGSLAVELKTVNHRYLEFQTRIPEELRPLEPAMREAVAARLTPRKVDCPVTFTPVASAAPPMVPHQAPPPPPHAAARRRRHPLLPPPPPPTSGIPPFPPSL